MTDLSKSEFLSFLYAEKSREIENSQVPGWSKWALWGVVATLLLNIYRIIGSADQNINNLLLAQYCTYCLAILLTWLDTLLAINARSYSTGKFRRLIEEAPLNAYFIRCILSVVGFHLLVSCGYDWIVCMSWAIGIFVCIFVIAYILHNRNHIVPVRCKKLVFADEQIDWIVLGIFIFACLPASISYPIQKIDIFAIEFETAFCAVAALGLVCVILNMYQFKDKKTQALDRIIDEFIIGNIDQTKAYSQYILLYYGANVREILEEDMSFLESDNIYVNYANEIKALIESLPNNDALSPNESPKILYEIECKMREYQQIIKTYRNFSNRLQEILKMQQPKSVQKELSMIMDRAINVSDKISNMQDQIGELLTALGYSCSTTYFCEYPKYCGMETCMYRMASTSLWRYMQKQISDAMRKVFGRFFQR